MRKHKSRSYIYLEASADGAWWLSGVQVWEFLRGYGSADLLLLKHQFAHAERHAGTGLDYVPPGSLTAFLEDNHYAYGDLALLDLPEISRLEQLPKQTVAELLYLANAWDPISSPFFPPLGNTFAYLSHDDGWLAKVWTHRSGDVLTVLSGIVAARLGRAHRRRVSPLSNQILDGLAHWSMRGLLIDFAESRKTAGEVSVPLHVMDGELPACAPGGLGIDHLLNHTDDYKRSSQTLVLRYAGRAWSLEP